MFRHKLATAATLGLGLGLLASVPALAANPPGTGQPGAFAGTSCGSGTAAMQPAGLQSAGFLTVAAAVYANPGAQSQLSSGNAHAISEYDIACFQFTQRP